MNNKTKIISLIALVLLLILAAFYLWPKTNVNQNNTGDNSTFPIGETASNPTPLSPTVANNNIASSTQVSPINNNPSALQLVYSLPVAGAGVIYGTSSLAGVYFLDRSAGHLYRASQTGEPTRLTNKTIPLVYRFVVGGEKNRINFVASYLKDNQVQNYLAFSTSTNSTSTDLELTGSFLSSNINQIIPSPQGDKILTVEKSQTGALFTINAWSGSNPQIIFRSPISDWVAEWPNTKTVILTTKASADVPGYVYALNLTDSSLTKIIGPIPGLAVKTSPLGDKLFYSGLNSAGSLVSGIYNLKTTTFTRLPLTTLANKCIWSRDDINLYCGISETLPTGTLPDDWYKGKIQFSDNLWRINAETYQTELLFNTKANNWPGLDAQPLLLNNNGDQLYLINRLNSYLLALDLSLLD